MKRGLVFCGGGAKGSYEAGVWKYLDEKGIKFDIVTGTSIGALNAAMYAQHTFDLDMEVWDTVTLDKIMKDAFKYDENVSLKYSLKQKDNLIGFLGSYIKKFGGDVSPFYELMDKYIFPEKIVSSDVTCGIVVTKFPSFQGVEIVLNKLKPELVNKYLVATASAFPILQVCKIGRNSYIDGGYYDNMPVNFAIELGAEDIVA
ncbi:MAG: patatin-like phospholipase family protein, partial [Acholeplasmatales bacterium]|nr:patatin-like phospholipase family protein [Acholeplasmatales bacterium]